jgi:NAD(P)H-nitrite reductase large subunit
MSQRIVIIGNGIAGVTAARFIRKKSNHSITVISSESEYFFSRTALMYVFMGHMKFEHIKPYEDWFWKKNKINLAFDIVKSISFSEKKVTLGKGEIIAYDKLIIATGSKSKQLSCSGENLNGVHTLYSLQDLARLDESISGKSNAVIIGGGLVGIELAEMLHSRGIRVEFLIREDGYWRDVLALEEAELISRHIKKYGITLRCNTQVKAFIGNSTNEVESVLSNDDQNITCDLACVAVGVTPNVDFLRNTELKIESGILVNQYLETSIPDIFAIGDCAQIINPDSGRKKIEPVWYAGKFMGEVVANTVCGNSMEYHPGNWYNSAKFFDIEYQVYGYVPNEKTSETEWFYWEDMGTEKSMRLVWSKNNNSFLGIQTLGIRISHPVIDSWINKKIKIGQVIMDLEKINFDPEFFTRHEKKIRNQFKKEFPELMRSKELTT